MSVLTSIVHTGLGINFASQALIALCIGFFVLLLFILFEIGHFDDDVICISTIILNSLSGGCAEREGSTKVCIHNNVFKIDKCSGLLTCEALLLCNEDHTESLPNAPHYDESLLAGLFKAFNRTAFHEK